MNRNRKMLALAFVFCFATCSYCEDAKSDKLFLWKVTSPTTSVYLLGSIHAGKPDFYPLAPEVEKGFDDSKYLVLEVDMDAVDKGKLQASMMAKGMYQGGDTLSKNVSKETMDLVDKYCEGSAQLGLMKNMLKPWMFSLMAVEMEMQKMNLDPEMGIDRYFAKKAKGKKTIKELESIEIQVDLISGFDKVIDEKALAATLKDIPTMKGDLEQLIKDWKSGDASAMNENIFVKPLKKHPESKPHMEKMFDERNVKMVEKIEGYLKTGEVHFVVAGAGHMVGDKGIVKLLQDKKYKIEQVKRTPSAK